MKQAPYTLFYFRKYAPCCNGQNGYETKFEMTVCSSQEALQKKLAGYMSSDDNISDIMEQLFQDYDVDVAINIGCGCKKLFILRSINDIINGVGDIEINSIEEHIYHLERNHK